MGGVRPGSNAKRNRTGAPRQEPRFRPTRTMPFVDREAEVGRRTARWRIRHDHRSDTHEDGLGPGLADVQPDLVGPFRKRLAGDVEGPFDALPGTPRHIELGSVRVFGLAGEPNLE